MNNNLMNKPEPGTKVTLNDAGLLSIFGTHVALAHMKSKVYTVTQIHERIPMNDGLSIWNIDVDDPELCKYVLTTYMFDVDNETMRKDREGVKPIGQHLKIDEEMTAWVHKSIDECSLPYNMREGLRRRGIELVAKGMRKGDISDEWRTMHPVKVNPITLPGLYI